MKKFFFHIIPQLDVGGTEKQLMLVLPQLQSACENRVVCLFGHGAIGEELKKRGVDVYFLEGKRYLDPLLLWQFYTLLRRTRPDGIITYLIYADIVGRIMARLARVPVVICSHRSRLFGPAWWHTIDRYTRGLVTRYTAQTHTTKELMSQVLKVPLQQITVIPNAVEVGNKKDPQPSNNLTVTCVANLKPEKRLDLLLKVFERLFQKYPNLTLWLVGEGPMRSALKQQLASYTSMSHIHLLGLRNDVPEILTNTSIFVLPTTIEGMSNALLEAMSVGLPCIASDLPVNKEIIRHEENGLLFRVNDEISFEQQLEYMITHPHERARLGRAAREYVLAHHSIPAVAAHWSNLIRSL